MSLKFKTPEEFLNTLERFIKTGIYGCILLSINDKGDAQVNELMVDYSSGKPIIWIKNPSGQTVPIATVTDKIFREFIQNFLEVSTTRTKSYEPSMWIMLRDDESGDTHYNQTVINEFHEFVENNYADLTPSILHTYADKRRHTHIPFVTSKMVFYDVGKIIKDEKIRDLDYIIDLIYNLLLDVQVNLNAIVDSVKQRFDEVNVKLTEDNSKQDALIKKIQADAADCKNKVDAITNKINSLDSTAERRVRSKDFTIKGNDTTIYPITFKYTGGGIEIPNGNELFMAPIYITRDDADRAFTLQLGNLHNTTSPTYYAGYKEEFFVLAQRVLNTNNAKHYVYAVYASGPGTYVVYLRGNTTYKVWSKYIETLSVDTTNLEAQLGYKPIGQGTVLNSQITNNDNLYQDTVIVYSRGIHVASEILIDNGTRMSIG